jgi:hypothetical protein
LANSSPIAQIFLKKGKPGDSRLGREFFEANVERGVVMTAFPAVGAPQTGLKSA